MFEDLYSQCHIVNSLNYNESPDFTSCNTKHNDPNCVFFVCIECFVCVCFISQKNPHYADKHYARLNDDSEGTNDYCDDHSTAAQDHKTYGTIEETSFNAPHQVCFFFNLFLKVYTMMNLNCVINMRLSICKKILTA